MENLTEDEKTLIFSILNSKNDGIYANDLTLPLFEKSYIIKMLIDAQKRCKTQYVSIIDKILNKLLQ